MPYHTIPYHTIPYHTIPYQTKPYHTIRDPRPAPPHTAPGKNGCPGPPRPRKISTLPRPAPPRKKIVLPRPENIDRMFRGKVRGKCSYITKRFCESKTFEQYFLAPKVLLVAP